MKDLLLRAHWFFEQFGINFLRMYSAIRGLPHFLKDLYRFKSFQMKQRVILKPCLHDRFSEGGEITEYFWQDLLVAQMIKDKNPKTHLDIGSRVDGFVAHLASFRSLEVLDIREITPKISNVTFRKLDLTQNLNGEVPLYESISCLHALEHFGLGRYGDPLDKDGYEKGIRNMSKFLKRKGFFYLSTPLGRERVEFNANRVFEPQKIVTVAKENLLSIEKFGLFGHDGEFSELEPNEENFAEICNQTYNLGLFIFSKE